MIRVTAKRDGFRRCGTAFKMAGEEFADDRFSKKELEVLRSEPLLVVEEIASQENPLAEKFKAIKAAKTAADLDAIIAGETDENLIKAAEKKRATFAKG